MKTLSLALSLALILSVVASAPAQVATPESVFGFRPGADDKLNSCLCV